MGAGLLYFLGAATAGGAPLASETGQPPIAMEPVPIESRAGLVGARFRAGGMAQYRGTLSGTLIKQSQVATTTWFLYPNPCNDRKNGVPPGPGTWTPKTAIVADSLDTYDPLLQNHGYEIADLSLNDILWHVTDGSDSPDIGAGLVISGSRSLWCGKYDPNWVIKSGYPNQTFQILYLDTDVNALGGGTARSGAYQLNWQGDINTEFNYDYLYLIGGGEGSTNRDPIGNSRARLDAIRNTGSDGAAELLVTMTGAQNSNRTLSYASAPGVLVEGDFSGESVTYWQLNNIPAGHRGVYFLFYADRLHSGEDGLWPEGHGQTLDDIIVTDSNGTTMLYDEQTAVGGTDPFDGNIIRSVGGQYAISARVAPGVGGVWSIQAGNTLPTPDCCSPQKQLSTDHMFLGADKTSHLTLGREFASIHTCRFPIPVGTASVLAYWTEYLDLPVGSGFVTYTEYRVFRGGLWSAWMNASAGGGVRSGALQSWGVDGAELGYAATADSVQLGYTLECVPALAIDGVNCQPVQYGVIYDDLGLEVVTGVPAPIFGIQPSSLAQSTFVDGTFGDVGCLPATVAAGQCWPGVRGSDVAAVSGPIHDNFNSPLGDSIVVTLISPLRPDGMGINWHYGFDKSIGAGRVIAREHAGYNPSLDAPRAVYRLFDPATQTWSPWDSSALDADAVTLAGPDTLLVGSRFRMNWPPRDKYYVNQGGADIGPNSDWDLPGIASGWSLNGRTKYSQVPFLPRGTRLQYYFKTVDIAGGVAYQFSSDNRALELENIPMLPGTSIEAPDIIEFDVLPSAYPPGTPGSLVEGRTDTPLLFIDGAYGSWSFGVDPIIHAYRGMGVRADRYRLLGGGGLGANIGGHELAGEQPKRLSNYFPNPEEFGIVDSLRHWYRIMVASTNNRTSNIMSEADALLGWEWYVGDTGFDGGDRCFFAHGDDFGYGLLHGSTEPPGPYRSLLAQEVFGLVDATKRPSLSPPGGGPIGTLDPFHEWGSGPFPLANPSHEYDIVQSVMNPNAGGDLTYKSGVIPAVRDLGNLHTYAIAFRTEKDVLWDHDRNKSELSEYSIQAQFLTGVSIWGAEIKINLRLNFGNSEPLRDRKLQRELNDCKAIRTPNDTTACWPCPADPDPYGNWATAPGSQSAIYGPLYPIQDSFLATGVEVASPPPATNTLRTNAPNPFNPATRIRFVLARPGPVAVRIFTVAGRLVRTLRQNVPVAGPGEIPWDGRQGGGRPLPSGIYFYRVRFPDGTEDASRMAIVR
jgi:hypothetical protein